MKFEPRVWWNRVWKDRYFRNSAILFFFTFAGSILQYVFQIYSNRNLSKDDYGLLNALLSLFMITGVVGTAVRTWNTKVFSQIYSLKTFGELKQFFLRFYAYIAGFLVIFIMLFLIFSEKVIQAYQTNLFWPFILLGSWLVLDYLKIPLFAFLESFHSFFYRSLALFSNSFFRVLFLMLFIYLHLTLNKVMVSQVFGVIISLVLFVVFTYKEVRSVKKNSIETPHTKLDAHGAATAFKIGLAILFNTLLINVDMQVARIHLSPVLSGDFATASVLGKTVFWIASISVPVFFVSINNAFYEKKPILMPFLKGTALLVLMTAGSLGSFLIFLKPFVHLFNPNYLSALSAIRYYTFSILPYVFINFLVYFFISTNQYWHFVLLIVLALLQTVALWFLGTSLNLIISVRLWSGILILAVMVVQLFFVLRGNQRKTNVFETRDKSL